MPTKIINIEIPVYNRDNVFISCFLEGLKYLTDIKEYVDISILYNGPNITQQLIEESNKKIIDLGFDLFYKHKDYNANEKSNIIAIREEVHQVNPNQRSLILQLDDDIQITSNKYADTLLFAALFMLQHPKAGVICFQSNVGKDMKSIVALQTGNERLYTSGGLLLKNMSEWNGSLYPEEARGLQGCWSDILVSFVRAREGLGCFITYSNAYRHYEIRKETKRVSGFTAHRWGQHMVEKNNSVAWLKKQGVGPSGGFSNELINSLWKPERPMLSAHSHISDIKTKIDNLLLPTNDKLLSIEVPSCNRQNALFKYFLPSLKYLTKIKDKVTINMNYNGNITEEEIAAANKIITELGFELYWIKNTYSFEKGKVPTVQFREDAHSLYPDAKYCLILDDDIEFVSENYADELLDMVLKMEDEASIGAICFTKNKFKENYPFGTFRKLPIRTHAWMDGGIILRNIKAWKGLFPAGLRKLFGTGEDRLCLTVRHRINLDIYLYYSNQVKHWEHHNSSFVPGRQVYGWDKTESIQGSILYYYKNTLQFKDRWVYDTMTCMKPNYVKRILNIELPVCDRKVFFQRLFPTLRHLKPLAPYCYFLINYQCSFTKASMNMVDKYIKNLGFEVISTFSEYNFNNTNHSIMKIRNDTHMLKPDTPFVLSIDSDMKILNEDYCIEVLNALMLMLQDENIGVAALETHSYHWPTGIPVPNNYENEFVYGGMHHHAYATDCGLILRNIFKNGLVPKGLQEKIGGLQDVLTVFERYIKNYKACCKKTTNATVLKDYENQRGRAIYGWASDEVRANPNSIWQYLKPFFTDENEKKRVKKDAFPGEPYWENPKTQKFISDINELNIIIQEGYNK